MNAELSPHEWNFEDVPEPEWFCCCWWECARESARIRAAFDSSDQQFFPDPPCSEFVTSAGKRVRGIAFNTARADFIAQIREFALPVFVISGHGERAGIHQPLSCPWQLLPEPVRQQSMQDVAPLLAGEPALTFLPFNRCADLNDIGLGDSSYRCAEFDVELGVERLRVEIDWAGFTDAQIVRAFKTWVGENRPPGVGTSDNRGTRKGKGFRDYLAWLGIMRLMHIHAYTSMEKQMPDAWSCYRSADWPRCRQKALEKFREFFPFLPPEDFPLHWKTAGGRSQ